MIKIEIYKVTELGTNCCYLVDEATGKAAVSDAGGRSEQLIERIKENGGKLEYVMLTHGHYDHICFAKQLADMFGAKIITGRANNEFLSNGDYNGTSRHNIPFEPFSADILLDDGDTFMLGETEIKYISTPGHTSGCGCYIFDDIIISGDCLFKNSFGRTDLPTGSMQKISESFKKLKAIEGDYQVIPGHGALTTLKFEKQYNPLMRVL